MPRKNKQQQPKKDSLTKADIKRVCDILRRDDGVGAKDYIEQFSWLLFLRVFEGVESQLKDIEEAEGRKYKPVIDAEFQWSSWAKKDWKDKSELIHFVNKKLFPYLKALKGTKEKDKIAELFRELHNKIYSPYNLLDVIEILDKVEKHHFQDTHLLSQVYEEILQSMGSEGGWSGEVYTPRPVIRLMIKIVDPKLGDTIFDPFVGSAGFLVESFNYLYGNSAKDVRVWKTLQTKTLFGKEKKPLPFLIGNMNMILHHILVPNIIRTNTLDEDVYNVPESEKYSVILTNPPFGGDEEKRIGENYPVKTASTEAMALQYIIRHLKNGGRCGVVLPEGNIMFGGGAMARIRQELLEKCNVHSIISLPQGVFTEMGAGVKTNLIFFDKTGSTKEIWYGEVKGKFTKKKTIKDEHLEDVFEKWKKREISESSWVVPIEKIKECNYDISPRNPNGGDSDVLLTPNEILKEIEQNQREIDKITSSLKNILKK
jgi:type I restriction enzyme M protein